MPKAARLRKPEPTDPAITRERLLQELGYPEVACILCGITEPAVMRKHGEWLIDREHVDGEAVSDLIALYCKNDHAVKHASRRANEDLFAHIENQSPLLQMAAAKIGRAIFYEQLARRERAEAEWLIHQVNRALTEHFGERWWLKYGISPFPGRLTSKQGENQ